MAEYCFYQDTKIKMWRRQHFTVVAGSHEEAEEIAESFSDRDIYHHESHENIILGEWDDILETSEIMQVSENHGGSTIEILNQDKEIIASNAPECFTKL